MDIKLPKKITPDRIRESVVQVFFNSEIPIEPLVGYLHSLLTSKEFVYTNRPVQEITVGSTTAPMDVNLIEAIIPQHFYFNEEVKIQLHQNHSLVFNCTNRYIGWTRYKKIIMEILAACIDKGFLKSYFRIGIRYISEFPNIDILEKINFGFKMDVLEHPISSGHFRIEWKDQVHKIVVNLSSKLPIGAIIADDGSRVDHLSLIDVDVINQDFEPCSSKEIDPLLETLHIREKQVFFGLLKDEFLQTLKPEY